MDYLDPKKKKSHIRKLYAGYAFLALLIGFATVVLVYVANGYYFDTKTGEVIQNGLVYVDTQPKDATILLNGIQQKDKTSARLVIPSGAYTIALRKDGYHDWRRSIVLEGATLRRITYGLMIPTTFTTLGSTPLTTNPSFSTQSPNVSFIVYGYQSVNDLTLIDTTDPDAAPRTLSLPATISQQLGEGSLSVVEWALDNRHILFKHANAATQVVSWIVVDTQSMERTLVVNTTFGTSFKDVRFKTGSATELYGIEATSGALKRYDLGSPLNSPETIAQSVTHMQPGPDNTIAYAVQGSDATKQAVWLSKENQLTRLAEFSAQEPFAVMLSSYQDTLYAMVSQPGKSLVEIFRDPLRSTTRRDDGTNQSIVFKQFEASVRTTHKTESSSVFLGQSGQSFFSYEIPTSLSYTFKALEPLDTTSSIHVSGEQIVAQTTNGTGYIMDFDGSNQHALPKTTAQALLYLNKKRTIMWHVIANEASQPVLTRTSLLSQQ